jgi:ribosome-associated translation inhibitor RaiA
MIEVELTVIAPVPRAQIESARLRIASLDRFAREPLLGARLTLRRDGGPRARPPYVADADVRFNGRVLAAHAAGRTAAEAADAVAEALLRQVRRIVGADVALRNEPRAIRAALDTLAPEDGPSPARRKPPEQRAIVRRRPYVDWPQSTLEAIDDLLGEEAQFHLFRHVRTGEDTVVHWRDDRRLGLLFPPGSPLADEDDVVVPKESRYSEPLPFAAIRAEMDMVNHRFVYFVDAADVRGKVLYLRQDGDYGLVEPPL